MELLITIIFLSVLGSILLFYSFREIVWYINKEKHKEKLLLKLKEIVIKNGGEIILIREPSKLEKKINPFGQGLKMVLPAFFGAGERIFYWVINYKMDDQNEKKVWVQVIQSIYSKPKYKFKPDQGFVIYDQK